MRLEVTRKSDLAVRTLIALARSGVRRKASALAEEIGATPGFVPQVVSPLVRKGWVASDPGPTGGYSLRVDPAQINVLNVIEAIEGVTDTVNCVLADRPCNDQGPCSLHVPWSRSRELLLNSLREVSIADLLDDEDMRPPSGTDVSLGARL